MARAIRSKPSSRTQAVTFSGLTIALMVVSAWFTVPIGPVPFTLQIFVMVFALMFLKPSQCLASIGIYLLLGAVGLPVFSGMRGGLGVLLGPTGGFLIGYVLGACAAIAIMRLRKGLKPHAVSSAPPKAARSLLKAVDKRVLAVDFLASGVFLAAVYLCGWTSMVLVAGFPPLEAFLVGIAPFILVDVIKIIAAVLTGEAVKHAVPTG